MIRTNKEVSAKVAIMPSLMKDESIASYKSDRFGQIGMEVCQSLQEISLLEKRKKLPPGPPPAPAPSKKSPRSEGKKSPSPATNENNEIRRDRNENSPRNNSLHRNNGHEAPKRPERTAFGASTESHIIEDDASLESSKVARFASPSRLLFHTSKGLIQSENKSRRIIRFDKRVRIRKVDMLDHMTANERELAYYSQDELASLRNTLREQIRVLEEHGVKSRSHAEEFELTCDMPLTNGKSSKSITETFCMRGLEHEFFEGKVRRRQNKAVSRAAVLDEQRVQRSFIDLSRFVTSDDSNFVLEDPTIAIAEAYKSECRSALQYAVDIAKCDEITATEIYTSEYCFNDSDQLYYTEESNE